MTTSAYFEETPTFKVYMEMQKICFFETKEPPRAWMIVESSGPLLLFSAQLCGLEEKSQTLQNQPKEDIFNITFPLHL